MKKLRAGDYAGPTLDRSRYLCMRNSTIEGNPRQTKEYQKMCADAVGVGEVPDLERYGHLKESDFPVIRWVVERGSGCMWLPDTPRTTVKGFLHRLVTRGPPVRTKLFRLNRPDTEWIEKAVDEDVKRGQLEKGSSDWGFPAFPTKVSPAYKAIQRGRRMVVDYRELNRVTVRKFFLIPNSDYIKSTVAGNEFISVGDLKEGFNQVDNEPETRKKMAVLSAGGCWLPRGLTFGPMNGPEDFQELVFTVFQRRLYKDWFLFVDDLSVATGRKKCHGDGPSGAHDVSCMIRPETESERARRGLGMKATSFPTPSAHWGTTQMTTTRPQHEPRLSSQWGAQTMDRLHTPTTTGKQTKFGGWWVVGYPNGQDVDVYSTTGSNCEAWIRGHGPFACLLCRAKSV
jgi:hypothetical protein